MPVEIKNVRQGVVASVVGKIAGTQQDVALYEAVKQAMVPGITWLAMDFTGATFLPDSLFIGRLVQLQRENRAAGIATYIIPGDNPRIKELFGFIMIEKVIPFVKNVDEIAP